MKKNIDKKKLIYYIAIAMFGYIIDIILDHYKFNLTYSFGILFINLLLYSLLTKNKEKIKKSWELIIKFFAFIILPILFSF